MAVSQQRIDRLAEVIKAQELDALLIAPSEDLVYLIGHSPMMCERFQGLLVTADGDYLYICNLLYADEIAEHLTKDRIHPWHDSDGFLPIVHKILEQKGLLGGKIGVSRAVRAFNVLAIAASMEVTFVDAMTLIHEARIIKSEEELAGLRKAAEIADEAFIKTIAQIKVGMTELQVKDILTSHMSALGGVRPGGLIASGPNGALPHYTGVSRVLQPGDAVVMDFGCGYDNMRSDMTRTIFIGQPSEKQKEVYNLVLASNQTGAEVAVEGAWIPDVDGAAREIIEQGGYGPFFNHRLGHGIGYMGHEAPDIKKTNGRKLEKGMAFSIEPGIYLAGEFGVRIEDIACINLQGETEILNQATKEMIIIN